MKPGHPTRQGDHGELARQVLKTGLLGCLLSRSHSQSSHRLQFLSLFLGVFELEMLLSSCDGFGSGLAQESIPGAQSRFKI